LNYYEILGLKPDASQDQVKRAYRKLARKYHPDVSTASDAEARFKEVGEAYAVLKDPELRAAYDESGFRPEAARGQPGPPPGSRPGRAGGGGFRPPPGQAPPDWATGFEFSGRDFGHGAGDGFGSGAGVDERDLLDALFRARREASRRAPGQDHHARVVIDLVDAYHGARRSVSLRRPVLDANGQVSMQDRQLEVSIPKGVQAGQHLRLAGQGGPAPGEGPAGDLYLEIAFNPDPVFRTEGRDVYLDLPVAPWEAALGATLTVPTPDGAVQLKVPPDSASGRTLRLKGRGIPGQPPGDLYGVLKLVLPPADTAGARRAYEAMGQAFDFNPRAKLPGFR